MTEPTVRLTARVALRAGEVGGARSVTGGPHGSGRRTLGPKRTILQKSLTAVTGIPPGSGTLTLVHKRTILQNALARIRVGMRGKQCPHIFVLRTTEQRRGVR